MERLTNPAYLEGAIRKVGMVDAEWEARAEAAEAQLTALRERAETAEREVERLREAAAPFNRVVPYDFAADAEPVTLTFTGGDFRRLRAALTGETK